ncbi:hypothetical protein CHGG_09509 [Chaetomium globosum CBS 148.51]|uniref:Uncharacterized protein n=1 Tax=Chaetomium globosum (strain ATCC 6205 / CBS 148.51 / DSM 1962 / NBRC 6347 / NRRL 1970) TaxID=306901 RepID=Q2GR95_CHAGB|nr:uncharacterized protein CHGG_09509 [Chaetomium globosum CBS 148.51]EAQ85495.1 hypothetical protein CHGG_09509 [Chaetomium globosum CBS 148.51]
MWRFINNSVAPRLKVPKRAPEDPTEFASAWKRRKDAEATLASETQQQQKSSAPLMQNKDDRTEPIAAVEDWLFSAEFNDRIEPPSDTPVDQELDELADLPPPAPEDEAVNSDTLTTMKIIQQELAEAELSECTQPLADEPALPPSALLEIFPRLKQKKTSDSKIHITKTSAQAYRTMPASRRVPAHPPVKGHVVTANEKHPSPLHVTTVDPWALLCDAFGLYNNMYRATMGFYLTGLFFEEWLRGKREGIFPLTLGPHGTDLADIVQSLFHMKTLDSGKHLRIGGRDVFVCSFVVHITGDMPSQSKLSGSKGHQALLPCRSWNIPIDQRGNLEYNIIDNGRYYMQHLDNISFVRGLSSKRAKDEAEKRLGVVCNGELMANITKLFPALDVLRSRPIDAAHSEFAGIARVMLDVLFMPDGLLLEPARNELAKVYQDFTFPPGWSALQNPKTHRGSYKMNEHARSSVLTPVILRCWLRPRHVRPDLHERLVRFAPQFLDTSIRFPYNFAAVNASDWIIVAFWSFTLSVLTIFGRNLTDLYDDFARVTLHGRKAVQFLFHVLGEAKKLAGIRGEEKRQKADAQKPRGASRVSLSAAATISAIHAHSGLSHPTQTVPPPPPSVVSTNHILHLPLDEAEYGCRLTLTFTGETKHKDYISDVFATNSRDPAPTLIRRENERQAISFALAGCFENRFPDVHNAFSVLRRSCPRLAAAYDPYYGENTETDEDCSVLEITADALHRRPLALYGLSAAWVKSRRDPLLKVLSPRQEKDSCEFMQLFRAALSKDYNRPFVMSWGKGQFQWAEKLSFAIRESTTRRVFTLGNFIRVLGGDLDTWTIARLDGIFTFFQTGITYLFAVVTHTEAKTTFPQKEFILECPIYHIIERREIIGLPRVGADRIWMVPRAEKGTVTERCRLERLPLAAGPGCRDAATNYHRPPGRHTTSESALRCREFHEVLNAQRNEMLDTIIELRDVVSKQQNTIQELHHQLQEYQRQMECALANTKAQLSEELRQARDQIDVLIRNPVADVRKAIETEVRTLENMGDWRCAAVVKETRNPDRVKVVCRDENETRIVKDAAQKITVPGVRVLRDQLYPVRIDNANPHSGPRRRGERFTRGNGSPWYRERRQHCQDRLAQQEGYRQGLRLYGRLRDEGQRSEATSRRVLLSIWAGEFRLHDSCSRSREGLKLSATDARRSGHKGLRLQKAAKMRKVCGTGSPPQDVSVRVLKCVLMQRTTRVI